MQFPQLGTLWRRDGIRAKLWNQAELFRPRSRGRALGDRAKARGPKRRQGDSRVQFNTGQRELTLKVVFTAGTLKVKLKLFTVPGQVMHNSTRRIVLQGTDAIAFIADSQPAKRQENYKYWLNMVENLKANGLDIDSMPHVVQWNKKDLGDASTDEAIEKMRRENKQPVYEAVAVRGEGVVETFLGLVELTFEQIDKVYLLSQKIGLGRRAIVDEVRRCLVDPPVKSGPPGGGGERPADGA